MRLCASVRQLQLSGGRPASKRERPICAAEQEGYAAIPRDDMSRGKKTKDKKLESWDWPQRTEYHASILLVPFVCLTARPVPIVQVIKRANHAGTQRSFPKTGRLCYRPRPMHFFSISKPSTILSINSSHRSQ